MTNQPAQPAEPRSVGGGDLASAPLHAIAQAVADAIIGADPEGRIILWVGGAEAIFGYAAEEALGRPIADLVPESRRPRYLDIFRKVVTGQQPRIEGAAGSPTGPVLVYALRRDGRVFPAELTLNRGVHDGEPFLAAVIRDISSRVAAEEELLVAQERFRSAFEHAATGMTMSAPSGRYLDANRAFCELVGRDRDEVLASTFSDITHPEDNEADLMTVARLQSGEIDRLRLEKRYVRPDGTPVWADVVVSLVRDANGAPVHYLTQALDVTDRRRAAEELERSNAELAQFAAVASHDLSEPLRIVDGFLALVQQRAAERLDEQVLEYVGEARGGAARMRQLIDALLRYAKAGADALQPTTVSLDVIAREALGALAAAIEERGAHVELEPLPDVQGDTTLLRQVLQNLLSNAVRHAATERPEVRVHARRLPAAWEVSVADNGPGVAAEVRPRMFDMFVRGRGGGAGLGLAICRRAVERHGGRIWVQDAPGGGADVRFTLPAD
jgi:PAS domain S-box-containing protein